MISLQEFRSELELMKKQYGQEEELYPYIYMLLREAGFTQKYSVRSVASARRAKSVEGRELLMGYAAFPDIAIVDKSFLDKKEGYQPAAEIKKIYCCVEAKKTNETLLDIKGDIKIDSEKKATITNSSQQSPIVVNLCKSNGKATAYGELIGELLWYGRVIYTNGREWKYLEINNFNNSNIVRNLAGKREELYKECVKDNKGHKWCEKLEGETFEVIETPLANIGKKSDDSAWERFKTNLKKISEDLKKNG